VLVAALSVASSRSDSSVIRELMFVVTHAGTIHPSVRKFNVCNNTHTDTIYSPSGGHAGSNV
jgi:hypothetical protein